MQRIHTGISVGWCVYFVGILFFGGVFSCPLPLFTRENGEICTKTSLAQSVTSVNRQAILTSHRIGKIHGNRRCANLSMFDQTQRASASRPEPTDQEGDWR